MAKYMPGIAAQKIELANNYYNSCMRKNQVETFAHERGGRSNSN